MTSRPWSRPSRTSSLREAAVALATVAGVLVLSLLSMPPWGSRPTRASAPTRPRPPGTLPASRNCSCISTRVLPVDRRCLDGRRFLSAVSNYREAPAGVWFASANGRRTALVAALAAAVATPLAVVLDEYAVDFSAMLPGWPQAFSLGVVPTALFVAVVAGLYVLMKRKFQASRLESVQAVFVFLAVGWVISTATCVFFRGQGMKLRWPF